MLNEFKFFRPIATKRSKQAYVKDSSSGDEQYLRRYVDEYYRYQHGEYFADIKKKNKFVKLGMRALKAWQRLQGQREISYKIFIIITFALQNGLINMHEYAGLLTMYGGWQVMIGYFFVNFFMALPLLMTYYFLSNFSRHMHIKFWCSVPILKGMAVTMIVLNLDTILMNLSFTILGIVFLLGSFGSMEWLNCKFPHTHESIRCMMHKEEAAMICHEHIHSGGPAVEVSIFTFLRHLLDDSTGNELNTYWVVISLFMCLLLFFFEMINISLLCKVIVVIWLIFFLCSFIVGVVYGTYYTVPPDGIIFEFTFFDLYFWSRMVIVTLRQLIPCELLVYGAMTTNKGLPTTHALIIIILRVIFTFVLSNWVGISINFLLEHYKISTIECLIHDGGMIMLYAIIPDFLRNIFLGGLLAPLYFILISIYGIISTSLSFKALTEALFNFQPMLYKYRKRAVLALTICCFFLNLLIVTQNFLILEQAHYVDIIYAPLFVFVAVACHTIIYTPRRLINDFHYQYGVYLYSYWTKVLKSFVLFTFILTIGYVCLQTHRLADGRFLVSNAIAIVLLIAPLVIPVLAVLSKRNKIKALQVLEPASEWGPPGLAERNARRCFVLNLERRFRVGIYCTHECLFNSTHYQRELAMWTARQNYFYEKYKIDCSTTFAHQKRVLIQEKFIDAK